MVLTAFNMLVYITMFYTVSPMGIRILAVSLLEFLTELSSSIPFFRKDLKSAFAFALRLHAKYSFLIYNGVPFRTGNRARTFTPNGMAFRIDGFRVSVHEKLC